MDYSGAASPLQEDGNAMPHSQIRPCIRGSKNTCMKAIAFMHFTGNENSHSLRSSNNWDSWHAIALLLSGISDWTEYQSQCPPCCSFLFATLLTRQQIMCLYFFSVVRVHSTEQNDPFVHTRRIGQRLSMAGLVKSSLVLWSGIYPFWFFAPIDTVSHKGRVAFFFIISQHNSYSCCLLSSSSSISSSVIP